MTTITVSNSSQLTAALGVAKGGDVISLAGGNYGDFTITNAFASTVTIQSADSTHPAVFNTLTMRNAADLTFHNVDVHMVPTAATVTFSPAVMIDTSKNIMFDGGNVTGGNAISGVLPTATATDSTGNVIGMPTGRGFTIQNSSGVQVQNTHITTLEKGIVLTSSDHVTITNNTIDHMRTTAIVGGASDLVINGNHLSSSHPWALGQSYGDHADFIALWTGTTTTNNVTIENNVIERGDGALVLGMWMQGGTPGFTNVTINNNAFLGVANQAIAIDGVKGGVISHNTLLQTSNADVATNANPAILLKTGVSNVDVSGNITLSISDFANGTTGNTVHDNIFVQTASPLGAGYYDATLVGKVLALNDASSMYSTVTSNVSMTSATLNGTTTSLQTQIDSTSTMLDHHTSTVGENLVGDSRNNYILAGSGNDTIDGHAGADTLVGGAGNDVYIAPSSTTVIVEQAGGGIDTVVSRGDYTLPTNVENLQIDTSVTNGWNGTGNDLNNLMIGNAGPNQLSGLAGNDTLDSGGGNDTLIGGAGADQFNFGKGYGVDHVRDFSVAQGDHIWLTPGTTYTMSVVGSNTVIDIGGGEQLILDNVTGVPTSAISGGTATSITPVTVVSSSTSTSSTSTTTSTTSSATAPTTTTHTFIGNSSANNLVGTSGNDTLDGRGGADTLAGGAGNDTYYVPNSLATVVEKPGEGIDTVIAKGDYTLGANVENLVIDNSASNGWDGTGNELNNVITGNAGPNQLNGMAGNDTLDGGAGNDVLIGGTGADQFNFGKGSGVDHIRDFHASEGDHVHILSGSYTVSQVGSDTVLDFGGGEKLILDGVKLSTLHDGWIH